MLFFYRMTLLLGPPGSGKTTLLLALAGKLSKELRVNYASFTFLDTLFRKIYIMLSLMSFLKKNNNNNCFLFVTSGQEGYHTMDMICMSLCLREPLLISVKMIFILVK